MSFADSHRDYPAWQGKKLRANQVHRALERLTELELVHRVELKNGYMACHSSGNYTDRKIFICRQCEETAEFDDPNRTRALAKAAGSAGLVPESR